MKTMLLTAGLLLAIAPAWAQDPMEPPQGSPPDMIEPGMEGQPPPGDFGSETPPPPVDRWLGRLKTVDSNQYELLQKLRKEDPAEFHRALFERLSQEKMKDRMRRGPHGRMQPVNPKIQRMEEEVGQISHAYREASDPAQKEQLRRDLRAKLEALFDLREKGRQEHIQRIQEDLAQLKATLDQRLKNRDQIIDRRLQELTESDGLRW